MMPSERLERATRRPLYEKTWTCAARSIEGGFGGLRTALEQIAYPSEGVTWRARVTIHLVISGLVEPEDE